MRNAPELRKLYLRPRRLRIDLVLAIACSVLLAIVGRGIELLCVNLGWSDMLAHWLDDAITGVIGGVLAFSVLRNNSAKRVELRQRLDVIGEMNHNVRNALDVIRSAHYAPVERERIEMIDRAARRIEESLRNFAT